MSSGCTYSVIFRAISLTPHAYFTPTFIMLPDFQSVKINRRKTTPHFAFFS
jgi:hypothetical protein